jgi:predicted nucleic acid-binding protein
MPDIIIADTSCLILLSKVGNLELLRELYDKVFVTPEIAEEFGTELPPFIFIREAKDKLKIKILRLHLDNGESSGIVLAMETLQSVIILDDLKARKIAKQLDIPFTGTIGIIVKAKKSGIIKSIKPILEKIKQTNFRVSKEIETIALFEAGE